MLTRVRLTPERIREGLAAGMLAEVEAFEPLHFDAGRGAANWLRDHVAEPSEPWDVILTFDRNGKLLGFFAYAYKRASLPPIPAKVEAMEVAWMARSVHTAKGFGDQLLTYAATLALDAGVAAFLVSPHDEKTAAKVWISRFAFAPVSDSDPEDEATMQVFLGLQEPPLSPAAPA